MAKRKREKRDPLGDFAENLGRLLGTTERKASAWIAQRNQVAQNLTAIRDRASELLSSFRASSRSHGSARRDPL